MKVGMRTPSLKKSVKAQTTGKVKRAVKKSVSPGYGQKGVGWIKDPKKAAYNKVYNKTTLGVGDVYRGIGGNGSRSSSNSSFSGSAAEIPEVRIPSKLEKVLTSSEKKKYISLVQTGCVLDQDRDAIIKANGKRISGGISTASKDYIINYQDLQGIGMTGKLALPTLIALCSIALGRPTVSTLAVLGEISISGTILKVDELANSLQVCLDSGAKKVLLPITSAADLGTVPPELVGSFNLIFYSSAEDAVFKALGVE